VARKYGEFPVVLETYRECLRDVLDVPGLVELLTKLHRRELTLVEIETPTASPFASSLLFDYVATYMYEGDTPNAERRAAALSLDRDLLRELLGQEELRDLIDADALASVEADLQCLSELTRATGRDGLLDVLRRVGDLSLPEISARVVDGLDPERMLEQLRGERRVARVRVHGEQRWIDAADAGLYRDALGVAPPGGLPATFLDNVSDALSRLLVRFAATHGPFTAADVSARYGIDASAALRELERAGELVRGELRPGGSEREWCDLEVLRRLRRASLAALRREIEPAEARELARFAPAWQGVDRFPASGAGIDRLREVLVTLQGVALPADVWERDVLPRRVGAYSQSWIDQLCASGELVWVGAGALGRNSGRVALYFREDLAVLGPPPGARGSDGVALDSEAHTAVLERLQRGACFFTDLLAELPLSPEEIQEALWDLAWAGVATNDAFAPLRAPRLTLARAQRDAARRSVGPGAAGRRAGRFGAGRRRRDGAAAQVAGRWSLTAPLLGEGFDPTARRRALAELLLERYGIVTREQVLAEGIPGGFSAIYPELSQLETLGVARRGYFLEGLGGAQFALPGAVERLRSRAGAGASDADAPLVLAAVDPAQPYGAALPWPKDEHASGRRPARVGGAYVVLVGGDPIVYVERGGKGLQTLVPAADARLTPALSALVAFARGGAIKRLALEKVDGEPAMSSPLAPALTALGFAEGPRRLTLTA
jgi:ATP-dependent helicase Lhr and Lhr-like helicase